MWCMFAAAARARPGGVKALRIMVYRQAARLRLPRRSCGPKSIERIRIGEDSLSPATISAVWRSRSRGRSSILLDARLSLDRAGSIC
jgi:hypothetical protein